MRNERLEIRKLSFWQEVESFKISVNIYGRTNRQPKTDNKQQKNNQQKTNYFEI
jgi:hypothetical protein